MTINLGGHVSCNTPGQESVQIEIRHKDPLNNSIDLVYDGECRSINELRKTVSWIK